MALTQDQITQAYQSQLGRAPDAGGMAYWTAQGNMDGFSQGAANENAITNAYQSNFGRPVEQAGYDYWTAQGAGNANYDYGAAIKAGAQGYDMAARDDTTRGSGITFGNADLNDPNLRYDTENNTWGTTPKKPAGATLDTSYQKNPYLSQMADDIGRRSNMALGQGLQSIRSDAIGVGGLGGSRQGVAEGAAISNTTDSLQGNLSNLFGTDWNNSQNRNLQKYGIDTNASLTNQGQMQNFYTANRGQDLQQLGLGAQLFGQGNAGYLGQGQGIYGIGQTQQQAPWQTQNSASQSYSPYTGYGGTNTSSGNQGGGMNGMVGGALAGAQIGKNLGLGGSSERDRILSRFD